MPSLQDLPSEIASQIIQCVSAEEDLLSLSLCSLRLHTLSKPILCAAVIFRMCKANKYGAPLRLLLTQPDLTHHVRSLHLANWDDNFRTQGQGDKYSNNHDLFETAIQSFCYSVEERRFWLEQLMVGNQDAMICLLLHLLPRLEDLDIVLPFGSSWFHTIISRNLGNPVAGFQQSSALCHLRHLRIHCFDLSGGSGGGVGLHDVKPFLRISSLRTFRAASIAGFGNRYKMLKPGISALTRLELEVSNLDEERIVELLNTCPNLKVFCCEYEDSEITGETDFRPSLIGRAIKTL